MPESRFDVTEKKKTTVTGKSKKSQKPDNQALNDLNRIEFHRNGFALVPDPSEKNPGIAYYLKWNHSESDEMMCSCRTYKRKPCVHIIYLVDLYRSFKRQIGGRTPEEDFHKSIWYRIASILGENCSITPEKVQLQFVHYENKKVLRVIDSGEDEILYYFSMNSDVIRFLERFGKSPAENTVPHRGVLLKNLAQLTISDSEKIMAEHGLKSIQQVIEDSFWYRMAYHCYREFRNSSVTFYPAIEETSGVFTVICKDEKENPIFRMVIPRNRVKSMLTAFKELLPNQHGMTIHPIPLKSIFKVSMDTKLDLEIRPLIQALQEGGEARFFEREKLERFQYGNLVYIKEMGILAELEPPGKMARRFAAPVRMVLKKSQIPHFLNEFGSELEYGPHIVDASVKNIRILQQFDRVELKPLAIDRDWCWLSLKYSFGNSSVSLRDIIRAKKENQRFISIEDGWIDCQSKVFNAVDSILDQVLVATRHDVTQRMQRSEMGGKDINHSDSLKISRMNLFRLIATSPTAVNVIGKDNRSSILKKIIELKPIHSWTIRGLTSPLRNYQKIGVEWLRFLYENGFGGLLCDDMGLGKTHQVMALMLALIENEKIEAPCIVICPTTVLSHWKNKISEHAPGLKAFVFHGGQRDLNEGLKSHNVLLTSYGILRNDITELAKLYFSLAVFDEIQNLKNPKTIAYEAAVNLQAFIKLGLTGTPIENNPSELKALFDLTLPGYLGTNENFNRFYISDIELDPESPRKDELRKLIFPFTLRRLKKNVLNELPEKIEDIRTCSLSDDQIKLYRDVISSRAKGLKEIILKGKKPVPYMHIFAVISLLKQICNHPALLEDSVDDYDRFQSGKWELFKELIFESLDSEQKVVVFSQYLGMIKIIESFFHDLSVDFVTLTGKSRKRGQIISRFNNDSDCRCFIGSLKAGGSGIDLVAASVVIHYDRWWNAAREDQATDRVHRIGQKRSVQVFKIITEGTLEEKIAAIIEKKRNLLDSIIREDDPGLMKSFSREDLISILSTPES